MLLDDTRWSLTKAGVEEMMGNIIVAHIVAILDPFLDLLDR